MSPMSPIHSPRDLLQHLFLPSLLDVFFAALLLAAFARPQGLQALLGDGDTGWHIRTGQLVLASGRVPVEDPFSFTRPREAWFAWEWLSDVLFARTWRWRGVGGVAALAGSLLVLSATLLLWRMLRGGAGLWIGVAAAMAAVSASSVHYLARPHIFSMLFYTLALWALAEDRRRQGLCVWMLAPLTALWANLHAGFVAWLATLGLLCCLCLAQRRWSELRRYAARDVRGGEPAESLRLEPARACAALSGIVVDYGSRAGVSISAHSLRRHAGFRRAVTGGGGADSEVGPVRSAAGAGLGIPGAALGAARASVRDCGRPGGGGSSGGGMGTRGGRGWRAIARENFLGPRFGIRTCTASQSVAAGDGSGGDCGVPGGELFRSRIPCECGGEQSFAVHARNRECLACSRRINGPIT